MEVEAIIEVFATEVEAIIEANDQCARQIGTMIHQQLVGNPDYEESNIVLNTDTPGEVHLYVAEEAKPLTIEIAL